MRVHLREKSHRHAPAKMGAGSIPCANKPAHARGVWIRREWNTRGIGELNDC